MKDGAVASGTVERKRRIGIIGAGPGGIAAAIRLKQAGYDDIVIFERADGVGGTWRNNRYPGLACDVKSHLYSFSFALNPAWSRSFAYQPEILSYMEGVVERFGLMPHIRLSTAVAAAEWRENEAAWSLRLETGETVTVDILVSAQGMFNVLNLPSLPGQEAFQGPQFHTAQWRDDVSLAGKRVAVIGTAASGVQMIPPLAEVAAELHVYQRSPSWVMPKDDVTFDASVLTERRDQPDVVARHRADLYEELDQHVSWRRFTPEMEEGARQACEQNLAIVNDPETRRKLTPEFNWGCTRPLMSNEYYQAYNRDNVELITDAATRITADAIVDATGKTRAVDVIIFATGFKTDRFASAIDIKGSGGAELKAAWADEAHAYLGMTVPGFPNLFIMYGPNTNNGSLIFMLECQADYIARHVAWMDDRDIASIDVKPEVEAAYNDQIQREIDDVKIWQGGCHNYYSAGSGRNVTQYPNGMSVYRAKLLEDDHDHFVVTERVTC